MHFAYIDHGLKEQWEQLVQHNSASNFMQAFFWADFKRMTGWETFKVGLFQKARFLGGAIVLKFYFAPNRNFLYIPEGPVLPYHDVHAREYFSGLMSAVDTIADLQGEKLTTHLRIEPRLMEVPAFFQRLQKAPYNMEPRHTLILDLQPSEQEILARMEADARYNIRFAERHGITIRTSRSAKDVDNFLKIYRETFIRNHFEGKEDRYFQFLIPHVSKSGYGEVFFAMDKKEIVASAIVIFYGNSALYFFGASNERGRQTKAPYKLQWEIIKYAKNCGVRWYDLGGIAPVGTDRSHPWYGFTQFKKKFGGRSYDFIGAYDFVYNPQFYHEYLVESKEI